MRCKYDAIYRKLNVKGGIVDKRSSSALLMVQLVLTRPILVCMVGVLGILVGLAGWSTAFLLREVLGNLSNTTRLQWACIAVSFAYGARAILLLLRRGVQMFIVRRVEGGLARDFLTQALTLGMKDLDRFPPADLFARFKALEHLRTALEERVLGLFFEVILVVVAAGLMASMNPVVAVLGVLGAILPAVVVFFVRNSIKASFDRIQEGSARLAVLCMDAFEGIRDLRIAGGEDRLAEKLSECHASVQARRERHLLKLNLIGNTTGLLSSLLSVGLLFVGAKAIRSSTLSVSDLVFLFTLSGTMLGPLENLVVSWIFFDEAAAAFERCREVPRVPRPPTARLRPAAVLAGNLMMEAVGFGYAPGRPVLQGLRLEVPAGTSLALVGESGAGKSTLISLLAGLYPPGEGRILLDGKDLREWPIEEWRQYFGAVLEHPHLFEGTVEDNIRLGSPGASDRDVEEAVRTACLREVLDRLPQGLRTHLTRQGSQLSAGQIQRVAIARAILRKPRVLLLDEATSNLDAIAEALFWRLLLEGRQNRTIVFVTHRLVSSRWADRIAVLDGGRIVECGSAQELMAIRGTYFKLWQRQTGEGSGDDRFSVGPARIQIQAPPSGTSDRSRAPEATIG